MAESLSPDRRELLAIAAWRQVLADRQSGIERTPEDYAALFPRDRDAVLAALREAASPRAEDEVTAGAVFGHYRLQRPLGRGGQGMVWAAEDLQLSQRVVALKLIRIVGAAAASVVLRLRREIELAVRADVDGVCSVFDTGYDGDFAWIAMRMVEGATLAEVLAGAQQRPDAAMLLRRVGWIEHAARIVHAVHERGVLHRDLKPGNLIVREDDTPVVLDFGVARALEGAAETLTATGSPVGTPAYMAPEQVAGHGEVGRAADIWALGAMLYECTTGVRPFLGPTPFELQRRIVDSAPPPPRQLNPACSRDLQAVVQTALAKDPRHRYATAEGLADDLRRLREHRPIAARPPGAATRVVRFAQRRPGLFAALLALVLVVAAALVVGVVLLRAADRELERANRAQQFIYHLSDWHRLQRLVAEIQDELAIDSRHLPLFEDVYARGQALIARLPEHAAFLAQLRAQGQPKTEDDPGESFRRQRLVQNRNYLQDNLETHREHLRAAVRSGDARRIEFATQALAVAERLVAEGVARAQQPVGWRFADAEVQMLHDTMAELVRGIESFAEARPGLPTALAARVVLSRPAQRVRKESLEDHAMAWREAVARIAAPDGRYGGLVLPPQEGLVPLGPDPVTGLEEFAHVMTGSLPSRDARGQLQFEPRSALVLVLLPGGVAEVGARDPTAAMDPPRLGPSPAQEVPLAPFFFGKHEVTQAQFLAVMHDDAARWRTRRTDSGPVPLKRHPVESISWPKAARFARRLQLDLPTDAQWEYACRAGTTSAWVCGDDPSELHAYGNVLEMRDGRELLPPPDGASVHAAVGSYRPNAFGVYDLHGNVGEWTAGLLGDVNQPPIDASGQRPPSGFLSHHVRGGSYARTVWEARSYSSRSEVAETVADDIGIRVAKRIDMR